MNLFNFLGILGILIGIVAGAAIGLYLEMGWWNFGIILLCVVIGWFLGVCLAWPVNYLTNKLYNVAASRRWQISTLFRHKKMINNTDNPVEWALLLYEFTDAEEHLADLTARMQAEGEIDEQDFRITLGHIYSHLNRAWNSRNRTGDRSDKDFIVESKFPDDIPPT